MDMSPKTMNVFQQTKIPNDTELLETVLIRVTSVTEKTVL